MKLQETVEKLSSQEKKVLLALGELKGKAKVSEVQKKSGLEQAAVMRAALALTEASLAEIQEESREQLTLTKEGKVYCLDGLPERRLLEVLHDSGSLPIGELAERANMTRDQIGISIGWIKRKGWAELSKKGDKSILKITNKGQNYLDKKGQDEKLLERLDSAEVLFSDQISSSLQKVVPDLKSRNLLKTKDQTRRTLSLTEKGERALDLGLEVKEKVSQLSRDLLVSGKWKEVELRRYNVKSPGPSIYPGKVHPQQQVVDELRSILLQMGFKEIKGPSLESEFWNFDALFQAQNHPARDIHDTLSLSVPDKAKIQDRGLLERVKKAHEEGVAGSGGWGYVFDEEISRRTIMCSQTTAATVRYLAKNPEPPLKVFCIQKVYRRERIDYKHLAEFPQAEGIVMAEGLNLRDMLGYLEQILLKMGVPKVRFRPGYFPYTEPSAEADGYFPEKDEWIELLGAGMFRPELLNPLGIRYPVLAWGIGFSRIAMIKLGIEDMRDLNNNDLEWLKKQPMV